MDTTNATAVKNMICKICNKSFELTHFNQKLCSSECAIQSRRDVKNRYKHGAKGIAAERRWRKNPEKKRIDKKYQTSANGRAKAVVRQTRLINNSEYHLMMKRLRQTAPYRRLRKWLIDKYKICQKCRSLDRLTIDHIIPMSIGGTHDINNVQLLCLSCNSRKKQKIEKYELQEVR